MWVHNKNFAFPQHVQSCPSTQTTQLTTRLSPPISSPGLTQEKKCGICKNHMGIHYKCFWSGLKFWFFGFSFLIVFFWEVGTGEELVINLFWLEEMEAKPKRQLHPVRHTARFSVGTRSQWGDNLLFGMKNIILSVYKQRHNVVYRQIIIYLWYCNFTGWGQLGKPVSKRAPWGGATLASGVPVRNREPTQSHTCPREYPDLCPLLRIPRSDLSDLQSSAVCHSPRVAEMCMSLPGVRLSQISLSLCFLALFFECACLPGGPLKYVFGIQHTTCSWHCSTLPTHLLLPVGVSPSPSIWDPGRQRETMAASGDSESSQTECHQIVRLLVSLAEECRTHHSHTSIHKLEKNTQ